MYALMRQMFEAAMLGQLHSSRPVTSICDVPVPSSKDNFKFDVKSILLSLLLSLTFITDTVLALLSSAVFFFWIAVLFGVGEIE